VGDLNELSYLCGYGELCDGCTPGSILLGLLLCRKNATLTGALGSVMREQGFLGNSYPCGAGGEICYVTQALYYSRLL